MNIPADFVERTKPLLGEEWNNFLEALQEDAPTSIRLNKHKAGNVDLKKEVPWCEAGFYLDSRPQFTFDPLFHAGCYYVQEASSMFVGHVLTQFIDNDVKVLDLCAAPGGKSTLMADVIGEDSLLVSNEVIRSRANILSENMAKWGNPNVVVTNNDPKDFSKLNGFFDIILVDAPCSGEGMFRKDEGAITEWSVGNVKLCKERQQRILSDVWPALKQGGILIYSTCTYNLEENEENVLWIKNELGADSLHLEVNEEWGITPSLVDGISAYRFFPHKVKGEGLFCAVLRKTAEEDLYKGNKKAKDKSSKDMFPVEYQNYVNNPQDYVFSLKGSLWYAVPKRFGDDIKLIEYHLNILYKGVCLGELKGKDLLPSQSLAVNNVLNVNAFIVYEIDWAIAVAYLRKETIVLKDQPKGYILLIYRGIPLGIVKNIGNRANNLYPQEWRIRSGNIPAEEIKVI